MQTDMSQNPQNAGSPASDSNDQDQSIASTAPGQLRVIKRNGKVVGYDDDKITVAISKAFLAVEGGTAAASSRIHETVARLTEQVSATFKRRMPSGGTIHIEEIQDQVELALMRNGEQKVARDYVLYREQRASKRAAEQKSTDLPAPTHQVDMSVTMEDGSKAPLDMARLEHLIRAACSGLEDVNADKIITETVKNLYDGVSIHDVNTSMVITARTMIEVEPNYSQVTARLLMDKIRAEALQFLRVAERASHDEMNALYSDALKAYISKGIELELLSPQLAEYDLDALGAALDGNRDLQFSYLGLQTLYDRYFIHHNDTRIELPQCFFMRVAMGLAAEEDNREARAIEFYNLLSSFDYMSSTPTLFNAGTLRPQLSSCYLTTVPDDLHGIYGAIQEIGRAHV